MPGQVNRMTTPSRTRRFDRLLSPLLAIPLPPLAQGRCRPPGGAAGPDHRPLRHVGQPAARGLDRARARSAHRRLHRPADQRRGARRGRRLPGVDAEHARAAVHPLHLAVHRDGAAEPPHRAGARPDLGRRRGLSVERHRRSPAAHHLDGRPAAPVAQRAAHGRRVSDRPVGRPMLTAHHAPQDRASCGATACRTATSPRWWSTTSATRTS